MAPTPTVSLNRPSLSPNPRLDPTRLPLTDIKAITRPK